MLARLVGSIMNRHFEVRVIDLFGQRPGQLDPVVRLIESRQR